MARLTRAAIAKTTRQLLINTINDLVNKLYVGVKSKVARKYIKRGLERIMWKGLDSRVGIKTEKRSQIFNV